MKLPIALSRNELEFIREIALEKNSIQEIAVVLKKSRPQLYKILKHLIDGGFIEKEGRILRLKKQAFIPILVQILKNNPHIIPLLADSGIILLKEMFEPVSINEIEEKTGLKIAIIYRKVQEAQKFNIVRKKDKKYFLNSKVWPDLKEFLENYKQYALRIAPKIDADLLIRGKYGNEIVVESTKELSDATPTAFSVYSKYGITIFMPVNYYHFPKKELNIKQIFYDSLVILKDDKDYRKTLYALLFYLKNKAKLKDFKNEFIINLKKVLNGEIIKGFPPLSEIKEKSEQYDIKI